MADHRESKDSEVNNRSIVNLVQSEINSDNHLSHNVPVTGCKDTDRDAAVHEESKDACWLTSYLQATLFPFLYLVWETAIWERMM